MNGKSFIPKVLGWYTRLKHFPILDMLRVEHFSNQISSSSTIPGEIPGAALFSSSRWGEGTCKTVSGREQFYDFRRQPLGCQNIFTVDWASIFAVRKVSIITRSIEPEINVNAIFFPQKIDFPVISQPYIGQGNRVQRQLANEIFRISKRLSSRPRCTRPTLLLGSFFEFLQLREQVPIQFTDPTRADSGLGLRSHHVLPRASSP